MSKIFLKISFVIAALACTSGFALAAADITGSTVIGGGTFSPSKSVTINAVTGPSGCDGSATGTPCNQYAARSKHASGDRIFATSSENPKIFYQTGTAVGTASLTEDFSSGWTAL